jgi:hypothetical protein
MRLRLLVASALLPFGLVACPEPKPPPPIAQAPIERVDAGTPPVVVDTVPDAPTAVTTPSATATVRSDAPPSAADCQTYIEHYAALIFKDRGEGPWAGKPLPPNWQPGGVMLGIRDQCTKGEIPRATFDCAMAAQTMPVWMKCVHP